jgi:hypothetical protein
MVDTIVQLSEDGRAVNVVTKLRMAFTVNGNRGSHVGNVATAREASAVHTKVTISDRAHPPITRGRPGGRSSPAHAGSVRRTRMASPPALPYRVLPSHHRHIDPSNVDGHGAGWSCLGPRARLSGAQRANRFARTRRSTANPVGT